MAKSLHKLSAVKLAAAIQARQVKAIDAVSACFERIDQHNDRLKALITVCRERAESEARRADASISQNASVGPLHGVPFTVKDLTDTAGIRTTYGSLIYRNHIPTQDEICVARLRAAGGILIGKSNTPEFGLGAHCHNALYGPTANPYDLLKSSGGSSGGAAAAVASGMCFLAQGTDMGGSVRTPASFCGVVGLRPAAGRIPRRRKPLLWDYLDTDGAVTRTVEDAALMLSVMAGEDWRDPLSVGRTVWNFPEFSNAVCQQLRGQVRVGFSSNLGIATVASEIVQAFEQVIGQIAPLCRTITAAHPDCSLAQSAFETMRGATLRYKQERHLREHPELLSESVRWNIEQGEGISAAQLLQAEAERDRLYLNFLKFFEHYDILVTPSTSLSPFAHTQSELLTIDGVKLRNIIDYLTITYTISLTGLPALSLPCGWLSSQMPMGLQLVGKPGGEETLLQFAYLLQKNFRL